MFRFRCPDCTSPDQKFDDNIKSTTCPYCGKRTEIVDSVIYWCSECNIPTFDEVCPCCGNHGKKIGTDLRPVFPAERLLIEILIGSPMKYRNSSVWCAQGSHYYADGKKIPFTVSQAKNIDADAVRAKLQEYAEENKYTAFDEVIERFLTANRRRYQEITEEAKRYIREVTAGYAPTEMYVSFSGGKDSTVVSSLVLSALSRQDVLHLYGDTTLEFPETYKYVARFKKNHPGTLVLTSKNKDKDFETLCMQVGPPSRVMRWCCTIFKTGAIQRKMSSVFKNNKRILTFYGIRRSESTSRSKYDRESDSPKIAIQKTVSPIIDWLDFDIWLYLLTGETPGHPVDFNDAYRLGYTRVGCWCCPNNSAWSGLLSKIYMPEQYAHFREMLIEFAKKVGKPDPEVYVDEGKWKARQGGNGLELSKKAVVTYEPCVLQEDTINYELTRPITEELYELFKPMGYINKDLGNPRLGEVYLTDKDGKLLLKLQGKIGTRSLKVSILDKKAAHSTGRKQVEDKIRCQITKYQTCIGCLGCESACRMRAINIKTDKNGLVSYAIDDDKCVRCTHCINHYDNGCYMRKVIRTKIGSN